MTEFVTALAILAALGLTIRWAARLRQSDEVLYHRSTQFGWRVTLPLVTLGTFLGIMSFIAIVRVNPYSDGRALLGILILFLFQGVAVWGAIVLHRRHFAEHERKQLVK